MKRDYASKSKNGVEAVQEVGQIPLVLIQAQTILEREMKYGNAMDWPVEVHALIDSVLKYIAKGDCDLSELKPEAAQ